MKLATFRANDQQYFGLVLDNPHTHEAWIFEPSITQERLRIYASRGTSPYVATQPRFWDAAPTSMIDFLQSGDEGMRRMRGFEDFMRRFIETADAFILRGGYYRVQDVELCAPVPRPQLIFGLVQNSPTVWRHVLTRKHLNIFPQGHQRPLGTVLGYGDPVVLPKADVIEGGWNPELGVIIGKGGRDIPIQQAMQHVAGFTVVSDVTVDYFRQDYHKQPEPRDWFEDAMTSWGDKKSDARFPMGPYLVTPDEVGNPYDLMIYTRQSGQLRDRSHTGSMHIGIERTISWLSSFRTLQPGDVIHMGTMGYDGSPFLQQPLASDVIESEIERVGILRNPVYHESYAGEAAAEQTRRFHPAPNIRAIMGTSAERISAAASWTPSQTHHLWILFGNYADAHSKEALPKRPYPRFLGAPASALASSGHQINIPKRAGNISFSCELACVIKQLMARASEEEAENAILGYLPLAVLSDASFADDIIEPASPQERHLPTVYARWADGFNLVGQPQPIKDWRNRRCIIHLNGIGEISANTDDYLLSAAQVIAYMTRYITLFPGDVITLGSLGQRINLPSDYPQQEQLAGYAEIEGLGQAHFCLLDRRRL